MSDRLPAWGLHFFRLLSLYRFQPLRPERSFMKKSFLALALAPWLLAGAFAQAQGHGDKETKADIERHRAMAAAHESAAKCLESGKDHDQCQKDLQAACHNLAIGKYCGMKHAH